MSSHHESAPNPPDAIAEETLARRGKLAAVERLVRERGLSQAAACRLVGISKSNFFRWRAAESRGELAPQRPVSTASAPRTGPVAEAADAVLALLFEGKNREVRRD